MEANNKPQKTVRAWIGEGDKRVEFDMPVETARNLRNLQRIIREQNELNEKNKTIAMQTKEFNFNNQTINFELKNKNIMVNATEMANAFGKKCIKFLELENTLELVKKLVERENLALESQKIDNSQSPNSDFGKSENSESQGGNSDFGNQSQKVISPFENEKKYTLGDEFTSKGKLVKVVRGGSSPGTWMDRRIAIAFAMWLDAEFYLWVCETIDEILFGSFREEEAILKSIAGIQQKIFEKEEALKSNPALKELDDLRKAEKMERRRYDNLKNAKITGFKTLFSQSEMTGQ